MQCGSGGEGHASRAVSCGEAKGAWPRSGVAGRGVWGAGPDRGGGEGGNEGLGE